MRSKLSTINLPVVSKASRSSVWKLTDNPQKGFTLVELLVAISIIGILSSLLFSSYTRIQQQSRNTERKNDIRQYQIALENFSINNGSIYPSHIQANGVSASSVLCNNILQYLSGCPGPEDPRYSTDNTYQYLYQSDGTGDGSSGALKWVLWAKLEGNSTYWIVCSNGKTGETSQSGFSVAGGTCPI